MTALRPVFTLDDATASGLRKDQVYAMVADGQIERIGRGVYARPDVIDPAFVSLSAATLVRADATLCLTSALAFHDLTDQIPAGTDIAIPRGERHPAGFAHVIWHSFDTTTFRVGREVHQVPDGVSVAIYSPERTLVDAFRLRHREGSDVAHEALRRWLRRRGSSPASLLTVADSFPHARPSIRQALEALL